MSKKIGQYRVEGTTDKCFVAISGSGKKWKVNLENFECQCREWQLTGLPCVHAVCVLILLRHPWIEYCSEYHTVVKYVATYNLPIHAIDDPSEWRQVLLQLQPLNCLTQIVAELNIEEMLVPPPPPPQTPIVRGRERDNSARGGRGSANSNNESGTSTNTRKSNGKNMGRATATRGRGTAAKTGRGATLNTGRGAASNTGRGALSKIGRGAASKIGRGAASNIGRAPFQLPRPAPYVATQSSQTTSVTNPYKKAYQTPTRN
ncbi:hypothetical protein GIB67_026067 [Kingdonia uniflora]|uniref:SWIM-type domain-containing protein n=1 Tax=Kingdonia uniflora TaxID=39325 RepID=A0A7J7M2W8_9MAGN|nr:hypothetical protein GIB67_026067 [Kingdonia uniflora]